MKQSSLILDGHKLNWHSERVNALLDGESVAHITIDCALTRACTYRCSYCYGKLQQNEEKHLKRDTIRLFLDDCAKIGVKAVSFVSDGESTCSPHLYDAICHGKKNGIDMALGTNGYLLADDRLEDILPCLSYLRFNISAASEQAYIRIHGCSPVAYHKVIGTIKKAVAIKEKKRLPVTIGLQMVLLPSEAGEVIPLAALGKELGVDYLVIKHCSDDEDGSLGVNYDDYFKTIETLEKAETFSDENYLVKAKWSKILSGGKRCYSRCYGPRLIMQLSGSGLVAPCGMLFNDKYRKYHMGNIAEQRFKDIINGRRYREVMDLLVSPAFDARTMCGTLCLQHKVNEYLVELADSGQRLERPQGSEPLHMNFI